MITVSPLPVVSPLTPTGVPAAGTGDGEMMTPVVGLADTLYGGAPPRTMNENVLPVQAGLVSEVGLTVIVDA